MEWRKCILTNQWFLTGAREIEMENIKFDNCPFCPDGQYAKEIKIDELINGDEKVICIPNPERSLKIEGNLEREGLGLYDKMNNIGADEIVIETLNQHLTFSQLTESNLSLIFLMYARRIEDLKKDARFRQILPIKSQGELTGIPFQHPISHIFAFPMVPKRIDIELGESKRHFQRKERCLFCDIISEELRTRIRIIEENESFISFCPFASRFPYEIWIAPLEHSCCYEKYIHNEKLFRLASLLKKVLMKLEKLVPAYFITIHTSPNERSAAFKNHQWETLSEDYHWHIEITPKFSFASYFERSSGFWANPLSAEKAADEIRNA